MCKYHTLNPSNVFICDVRSAKMCVVGAKKFLEDRGYDFREFLEKGIDPAILIATGDPMARKVVEASNGRKFE